MAGRLVLRVAAGLLVGSLASYHAALGLVQPIDPSIMYVYSSWIIKIKFRYQSSNDLTLANQTCCNVSIYDLFLLYLQQVTSRGKGWWRFCKKPR